MESPEDIDWFLATTANETFWDTSKPIVFLGEWCLRYSRRPFWQHLEGHLLKGPFDNSESLNEAYRFIGDLYEELLPILGLALNKFHETHYSTRYWRIVIGPWFYMYITVLFDRYHCLKQAIRLYPNFKTICLSEDSFVTPSSTLEFAQLSRTDSYNLQIYTRILSKLGKKYPQKSIPKSQNTSDQSDIVSSFKHKLISLILGPLRLFADFASPSVFLHNSYFPRIYEIKLACKSHGRILSNLVLKFGSSKPSSNSRSCRSRTNLDFTASEASEFEACLSSMLPLDIPKCFIEDFRGIYNSSRVGYPRHVKALMSANSWYFEETFKQYAAICSEQGSLLLGTAHGGDYGGMRMMAAEDHETSIVDFYYSWGWSRFDCRAKVIPMPSSKLLGRRKIPPHKKFVGALWLTTKSSRYLTELPYTPKLFSEYLSWQLRFARRLSPQIISEISVRPHFEDHGWDIVQRLQDEFPHMSFESWDVPFQKRLVNCRLYICDHFSTTFAEALAVNKPTILFWNPEANELRQDAVFYYDLLKKYGILYDHPEAAADAVNHIYDDVLGWWNLPERQDAIRTFCDQFARTSVDGYALWNKELSKY